MLSDIKNVKSVIVLMLDKHIGNLVVSLPAIMAAKEFFKKKDFYLAIDEAYKEIAETSIDPSSLILYPRRKINTFSTLQKARELFRFICLIRKISPDIVIDLEGRRFSSIIAFASGAPLRVGKATGEWAYLYNRKVNIIRGLHKAYTYISIIQKFGIKSEIKIPYLNAQNKYEESLQKIFINKKILLNKPIVCIHLGASKVYKQWSLLNFSKVCDWLSSQGFKIIFVGGEKDKKNAEEIKAVMKSHSYNFCNMLSLGELIALFKISSLYIGNDSGPMHIASATGTPVIALFGPADENRWGPLIKESIVLRGEPRCQKCRGRHCPYEFKCIMKISVNQVKFAVEEIINSRKMKVEEIHIH